MNLENDIIYLENRPRSAVFSDPSPGVAADPSIPDPVPGIYTAVYHSKYRDLSEFKAFLSSRDGGGSGATSYSVSLDHDLAVIQGARREVESVEALLYIYDRPVSEVDLKISVVEYQSSSDDGKSLYFALDNVMRNFSVSIGDPSRLRDGFSIVGVDFGLVLSAFESDNNFNIVDTSTLRVVSGKAGRVNVGQEVPILSQFTQDDRGRNFQSVQYRASGLIVDVKPVVVRDVVHADILQQLSSFAITSTSNIDSPTLLKREINTSLTANFSEVVLIGGLEEKRASKAGVSFFGIPFGKQESASSSSLFLILEFSRR